GQVSAVWSNGHVDQDDGSQCAGDLSKRRWAGLKTLPYKGKSLDAHTKRAWGTRKGHDSGVATLPSPFGGLASPMHSAQTK
ncbi:MAG: hypothetical protein WBD54_10690, partial [Candidatus Acidiferrales bacterium]